MNVAELERLLTQITQGPWSVPGQPDKVCAEGYTAQGRTKTIADCEHRSWMGELDAAANAELIAMAPALARRVIAAERMADAARTVINSHWQDPHVRGIYNLERHLTAYEATK